MACGDQRELSKEVLGSRQTKAVGSGIDQSFCLRSSTSDRTNGRSDEGCKLVAKLILWTAPEPTEPIRHSARTARSPANENRTGRPASRRSRSGSREGRPSFLARSSQAAGSSAGGNQAARWARAARRG